MTLFGRRAPRFAFLIAAFISSIGYADETPSRFSAGGYFRIQARPDFQGGNGGLGIWNLYGRLLNEGPYAMLQSQLQLIQADPNGSDPYANVNVRVEGGFLQFSQGGSNNLENFRISQFYVTVGNVALSHVTWQVGSLYYYPGDLGLYDFRPAQILENAVGLSATWHGDKLDLLVGAGDSGYGIHGSAYDTVYTVGGFARWKPVSNFELGIGGHFLYEPGNLGNPNSPYATEGVNYVDYFRQDVIQQYALAHAQNPGALDNFPKPSPRTDVSWRGVAYLGFGDIGPIKWSSLYGHVERLMPRTYYTDTYQDPSNHIYTETIYLHDLTDQRYDLQIGNEMQLTLIPHRLDAAWGVVYGMDINNANTIAAGEDNRWYASTVLRLQVYATNTVHFLFESSFAHEKSLNGSLWREHHDSIFQSTLGVTNAQGLEFGDTDHRNTWQGKLGVIFNPAGRGIYMRPSLRLLYGLQYSNMQAAFGNSFQTSLDQFNQFPPEERHWHQLVAVEAEGWF